MLEHLGFIYYSYFCDILLLPILLHSCPAVVTQL